MRLRYVIIIMTTLVMMLEVAIACGERAGPISRANHSTMAAQRVELYCYTTTIGCPPTRIL